MTLQIIMASLLLGKLFLYDVYINVYEGENGVGQTTTCCHHLTVYPYISKSTVYLFCLVTVFISLQINSIKCHLGCCMISLCYVISDPKNSESTAQRCSN